MIEKKIQKRAWKRKEDDPQNYQLLTNNATNWNPKFANIPAAFRTRTLSGSDNPVFLDWWEMVEIRKKYVRRDQFISEGL